MGSAEVDERIHGGPDRTARVEHIVAENQNLAIDRAGKLGLLDYGLGSDQEMTLEEIGQIMGLTRERIRQIKEEAFEKIRSSKAFKYMHDYAEETPV